MLDKFIETGIITGTHGLAGEVRVQPWADSAEFLKDVGLGGALYLLRAKDKSDCEKLEITSARVHKNMIIMKIKGVDSIDDAEKLRGKKLCLNRDDVALEEDTYFIQDMIGLDVLDCESGEKLGTLEDVTQTGANDVYNVRMEDGRLCLIPAIEDVVKEISPEDGFIRVFRMKGLFDDEN